MYTNKKIKIKGSWCSTLKQILKITLRLFLQLGLSTLQAERDILPYKKSKKHQNKYISLQLQGNNIEQ